MDGMDQVRKVAAGSLHSAVVTVDGSGWSAGSNEAHALGNRSCEDVVVAPAIPMPGDPQQSRFAKVNLPGKEFDVVVGDGFSVWLFGEFSVSLFSLQHPQSSPRTMTNAPIPLFSPSQRAVSLRSTERFATAKGDTGLPCPLTLPKNPSSSTRQSATTIRSWRSKRA